MICSKACDNIDEIEDVWGLFYKYYKKVNGLHMKIPIYDYITAIISLLLFLFNVKKILKDTRYVIYCIFFAFYVFPLVLDCFVMVPRYIDAHRGFAYGQMDLPTRAIYDVLILLLQLFLLYFKKEKKSIFSSSFETISIEYSKSLKILLIINLLIGPIIALINHYPIELFFVLQAREGMRTIWGTLDLNGYTYVEMLTYNAVVSGLLLIFDNIKKTHELPNMVFYILLLYINLCLEGKRAILFFTALVVFLIFLLHPDKQQISTKKAKQKKNRKFYLIIIIAIIVVICSIGFTIYVNMTSRGMSVVDFDIIYVVTRVDFLRDDRVRMAIFSFLHPERQKILDYPMQSILVWPFTIVPLDYFVRNFIAKFYTYSDYISAVLRNTPVESTTSFMTPTIYAELISNMGIVFGTISMCFFCWKIIQLSKKYGYPYNVLIITCFIQFLMFDMSYVVIFVEFVWLAIILKKYNIKFGKGNRRKLL